ncbi:MAG: hypothetical protein ACXVEF_20605 [Polyangiales bacterium]
MRALLFAMALSACGSEGRPHTLGAGSGHAGGVAPIGAQPGIDPHIHVTRLSSLTGLPRYGAPAPDLAVVSDREWLQFVDQGVNIYAHALPDGTGDMYLPIFEPTTWGLPSFDRGTVVLQLVDADGYPIEGAYAEDPPCGSSPRYDAGEKLVEHGSTGNHGTIALFDVPPAGDVALTVHVGAEVFVAQVPIVSGTVTYVQTKLP